jgi:ribosomal protein S18 acetylase RimI-like enzyme
VRWNISDDGETGFICALAIRPDFRGRGVGNNFIRRSFKQYPNIKYLVYKRERKTRKEERKIPIAEFLKHNKF